jgi:hypothetical protein
MALLPDTAGKRRSLGVAIGLLFWLPLPTPRQPICGVHGGDAVINLPAQVEVNRGYSTIAATNLFDTRKGDVIVACFYNPQGMTWNAVPGTEHVDIRRISRGLAAVEATAAEDGAYQVKLQTERPTEWQAVVAAVRTGD